MGITVKASDLKFKYPKDLQNREEPKFSGIPDPTPFNRDDLYDILPMMEAVMDALESTDGRVLHLLEDILNEMPRFFVTREEVYACLVATARERLP
ncbi:hypothetical protein FO488_07175 [Geobacter sp. FeAm09]|uniref:hypothetical protein n=1 Tax=Geobacter sp. FeAm09 TaxID=2597769 RepID=UPI0011EEA3B9|nr:hypothetical protein [Geobacter sp. FeAm09]QEM67960.1 hypothetical protein FO488_07175 [Geobacter sp. FeAm09]